MFGQAAARAAKVPLGASYIIGAAGAFLPILLMGVDAHRMLGYLATAGYLTWRFERDAAKASEAARLKQQEQGD
jgi:hypothetical protein